MGVHPTSRPRPEHERSIHHNTSKHKNTNALSTTTHPSARQSRFSLPSMSLLVDFPSSSRQQRSSLRSALRDPAKHRAGIGVVFSLVSEAKIVANLSALRDELFYTQDEFAAFRHNNRDLVIQRVRASGMTMAEFAERNVTSTEAFMGLEAYLSRSTSNEICLRKAHQLSSVLAEQNRQQRGGEGAVNPDKLAKVSRMTSAWARSNASIKGRLHSECRP